MAAVDPEFERMMQEDDDDDDDLAGLFEDDDRERSESYLAEEPPAKRARGEGDDEVLMLAPKQDGHSAACSCLAWLRRHGALFAGASRSHLSTTSVDAWPGVGLAHRV